MSSSRARRGRSDGIARQVPRERLGVAARVDDVPHAGRLEPAAELGPDPAPRRVHDHQVRRGRGAQGVAPWRRRPRSRTRCRPASPRRWPGRSRPPRRSSRPRPPSRPGAAQWQREAADAAVEVPHRARARTRRPSPGPAGRARRPSRCWSGRSSAGAGAGPRRSTRIVSVSCSVSRISVSPSSTALCSGCRFTDATASAGSAARSHGQVLADPRDRLLGAKHEPDHQLAVGRLGHQEVLEFAGPARDVVRRECGPRDERRRGPRGCLGCPGVWSGQSRRSTP